MQKNETFFEVLVKSGFYKLLANAKFRVLTYTIYTLVGMI